MDKYRLAGIAVAAVAATPIVPAYAVNFDFTLAVPGGGDVTGEIIGLQSSGRSAATQILIQGVPANFEPPAVPYNFLAGAPHIVANSFTVSNGQIVGAHFYASNNVGNIPSIYAVSLGFDIDGTNLFRAPEGGVTNQSGFSGVTYAPLAGPSAVPEPASIALLGAGLAGISAFRRRRAA